MAAAGILDLINPVDSTTLLTLMPRINAAFAEEGTDGYLQICGMMAATGTKETNYIVVIMMMKISKLQIAQPV